MSAVVYIGTPGNSLQASLVRDLPVLVSFGAWIEVLDSSGFMGSFGRLLLDSGAYSVLNSGKAIDLAAYVEWAKRWPWADAWAGLDDISGDWRQSMKNYDAGGFPTFHDTDPDWLLDDLVELAHERGGWLGIGLKPPRTGREEWLRRTIDRVPDDIHVHGWALGRYAHVPGIDSWDSTHAWREWMKIRQALGPWLTSAEAMQLAVTKVHRESRSREIEEDDRMALFNSGDSAL